MSLNIVNSFKITPPPPGIIGGWVELARTTLGSAATTVSVASIPDRRYYKVLVNTLGKNNSGVNLAYRYGVTTTTDSGSNYAYRYSVNGAADGAFTSSTSAGIGQPTNLPEFSVYYISNLSAQEKLIQGQHMLQNTAGAGTAPLRTEFVNKWVNTSNPMGFIEITTNGAFTFNSGSEVVVLGWDPADTHTTNFWEELASVELSVAGTLSSSFTAKKYLWVQAYLDTGQDSANEDHFLRLGSTTLDTGTNYSYRRSHNGAADATSTSQTGMQAAIGQATTGERTFVNLFIVNNSANEKLVIDHAIEVATAGAGTAPARQEMVGKWANTSNQADILGFRRGADSNYDAGSFLKIWGSD